MPPPPPPNKKKEMNNNSSKKSSRSITEVEVDLVLAILVLVLAVEEEVPCNSNNSSNSKSMMSMITEKKKTASREKIVDRVSRMKAMGRFDGILGWGVELEIIGVWLIFLFLFLGGILYTSMFGLDEWMDGLDAMDE